MKKSLVVASVLALSVTIGSGVWLSGNVSAAEAVQKITSHFGDKDGVRSALDKTELAALLGLTAEELRTELHAGKSLAAIAGEKKIEVQKIIDLQIKTLTTALDKKLKDGKITQTEYDTQKKTIAAAAEKIVNGTFPGKGPGGDRRHGGKGFVNVFNNDEFASLFSLTADELRSELKSGKSLETLAGEKKVAVQTVTEQITKELTIQLDKRLADGSITQAQYDEKKAALAAKASEMMKVTFMHKEKRGKGGHSRESAGETGTTAAAL